MAQKLIAQHWMDKKDLTVGKFVNIINWLLCLEKRVYMKRGPVIHFRNSGSYR